MTIDREDLLKSILESIKNMDYVKPEEIPGIELYMDQVTTFMENKLASTKRYSEDKILTKTMINNYAKNNLLPPPNKKKYSKEHLMILVFIYYLKNMLSINDIKTVLAPITEKYFETEGDLKLSDIYREIVNLGMEQSGSAMKDITRRYEMAQESFQNVKEEDREFLQYFSFICLLSFDVYVKKQLIEKLIDELSEEERR
jgi:DNA-binding transcriptional MerR regulator